MSDPNTINIILSLLSTGGLYILAPISTWYIWTMQKKHALLERLFERVTEVEQSKAVTNVMIKHIEEDVAEIKLIVNKLSYGRCKKVQP